MESKNTMTRVTVEDGESLDIVNDNLHSVKIIFPEAFTEDGVDFDTLRQLLGDDVDEGEEKYGLNWHGKKKARQIALTPSLGTLRPCPEESVDWDTTQNLFIEGDNLEVLKLLQKSYAGKVKMIYIDPPYNTGKEFIYPDHYQDNLDTYLKYTGQRDDDGFKFSSNTDSSGRFHTNWLKMMYPRLKLARNLLSEDGILFASIDDHEVVNLRVILNEIFGEENFLGCFVWKRRSGAMDAISNVSEDHEYVCCYSKVIPLLNGVPRTFDKYSNPDSDPRGDWISDNLSAGKPGGDTLYAIVDPDTGREFWPPKGRYWPYSQKTMKTKIEENRILFPGSSSSTPMLKRFKNEAVKPTIPVSTWIESGNSGKRPQGSLATPMNSSATKGMKELFGNKVFSFPKPPELIQGLISQATSDEDIVLDFFAGSGTAAESVMRYNASSGKQNRYILVQLPEVIQESEIAFQEGYKTIASLAQERIRRTAAKIREECPGYDGDLGFKVFKLDGSNIRTWNPDKNDLEQTLLDHTEHLVEGRSEEDVLYELLLKRGVDLTVPIDQKGIEGKAVYSIGYGVLFACLDTSINRDEVEVLAQGIIDWHKELDPASDTQIVFRDSAFADDIAKTNMTAILEQNGIAHMRSL